MKVRHGFVSNSSTSSFLCDVCGTIEADRDLCIDDAGMLQCKNEHTLCIGHMKNGNPLDISRSIEEKRKILLDSGYTEKEIGIENEEIEDRYEDWKADASYEMPPALCPFCQLERVTDDNMLLYLLKRLSMSKEDVIKQIEVEHGTYEKFSEWIKSQKG